MKKLNPETWKYNDALVKNHTSTPHKVLARSIFVLYVPTVVSNGSQCFYSLGLLLKSGV